MKHFSLRHRTLIASLSLATCLFATPASANGAIGEHVNHLQEHISSYSQEVNWLVEKLDGIVQTYAKKGKDAAHADMLIEHWEAVDFHSAIETNYIPVYAMIWQGIYGVKTAIDNNQSAAEVVKQQEALEQALWQALGAVKLAAKYQQQGLLSKVKTTENLPTTPTGTLEEIKHRMDRVVAKYAERLSDTAVSIVHDTYLNLFEGVEGGLIELDANLVEDLEKDFNVTLPQAIQSNKSVDQVRAIVVAMQAKLDTAKSLLEKAESARKDVF